MQCIQMYFASSTILTWHCAYKSAPLSGAWVGMSWKYPISAGAKKSTLLRFFGGGQQIKNRVHCGKTIKIFSPLSGEWVVVSWKYLDVTSSPRRWRAMVSGQGSWEKSIKARYQVSFHQFHYVAVRYQCLALTNHHLFQKTNICWLAVYKFAINQFELSASVRSETDIFWESLMERKYWKSTSLSIKSPGLKASK